MSTGLFGKSTYLTHDQLATEAMNKPSLILLRYCLTNDNIKKKTTKISFKEGMQTSCGGTRIVTICLRMVNRTEIKDKTTLVYFFVILLCLTPAYP